MELLILALFGWACAAIASSRGRSVVAWFILGCLLHVFALVLVLVLPDVAAQEENDSTLRDENRRLRERLRKDRQVADRRFREVDERLSVHDRALGVDTVPRLPESPAPFTGPARDRVLAQTWHWSDGRTPFGPIDGDELLELFDRREITVATLVWTPGMAEWRRLADVPELRQAIGA